MGDKSMLVSKPKLNSTGGEPFEVAENPGDKDYVPCHLPIQILFISATYKKRTSLNPTEIPKEYTWAMEEAAEWCKEYITSEEVKGKNAFTALKIASDPETYAISNYSEYIPINVLNAQDKYKQIYLDKHTEAHKDLKLHHITVEYRVFKCNKALTNNQKVESYYRRVHLLPKGVGSLKKREIISVNATLEFKIADLTEFEFLGPSKQTALLDSIYTHVLARGVFEAGSGRNNASLQRSRSSQFLLGMKDSCTPHYFDRFKFALRNIINKDVDDDFVCTWQHVETAMFQAIGKENRVNRLHSFNKIKPSDFHTKPLEILIADVDGKIDASLGKSLLFHKDTNGRLLSYYSYSIFHKYNIILGITEHLGSEFNQIKD